MFVPGRRKVSERLAKNPDRDKEVYVEYSCVDSPKQCGGIGDNSIRRICNEGPK